MFKFITLALIMSSLVPMTYGADDTQIIEKEKRELGAVSFQTFKSCEAMEGVLTKYFKKALIDQIATYGTGREPMMMEGAPTTNVSKSIVADGIGGGGDMGAVSQTNVQIAGIDEADIIKTDGKFIYYTSNTPDPDGYQYVVIARATPATQLSVVKRIKLPSNYGNIQLYLSEGKLTILATRWNQNPTYTPLPVMIGNGSSTVVSMYDVSDVENLQLIRFYTVNGDLSQSRREGDYLYVLSQNYVSINPWSIAGVYTKEEIATYLDKKFDASDILPETIDLRRSNTGKQVMVGGKKTPFSLTQSKVNCNEVEYILPEKPQNLSFLTLSVIPLSSSGEVTRKVIYGDAAQFFMTKESFYIVSNYWVPGGDFSCPFNARCIMPAFRTEQNSLIHRFAVKGPKVSYAYSTLVPGMPLSQYAMHEKDEVLFTANQKDWTTNGVDIFAIDSGGKLLSKLENIGPNERFQAARYMGNRLYLVTFEQTDPLFVISTLDPKNMKVLGELVMPGYSTYLHPYDENHLIGIGFDTKTNGWGSVVNGGLKVDLYDVTNVAKPKQQYSEVFGGMGSSSDALWNPRALVWDSSRHFLLMPAQLMDQNPVTYQYNSAWQGLLALHIDTATGIQAQKITHIDMSGIAEKRKTECAAYKPTVTETQCYTHIVTGEKVCLKPQDNPVNQTIPTYCYAEFDDSSYLANQIWNLYPSFIQRGIYIGDTIYTVSPSFIRAHEYKGYKVTKELGSVTLQSQ